MSRKSAQELFPALFGKPAAARPIDTTRPGDMRLVQYLMRQQSKRPAALAAGTARPTPARAR